VASSGDGVDAGVAWFALDREGGHNGFERQRFDILDIWAANFPTDQPRSSSWRKTA
jgi:hypothetical protein